MANFCTKCGAPLRENIKFCPQCGTPCKVVPTHEIHPRQWTPAAEAARLEVALHEVEAALQVAEEQQAQEIKVMLPAKKQKARKTSTAVISVLLCVLMVIAMLGAVIVFDVRALADQEKLYRILSRVDLTQIPAEDLVGAAASGSGSLDQYICDAVNGSVDRVLYQWEDMKPKTIHMLLTDTNLLYVLSEKGAEFLQDIYTGQSNAGFDASELEAFLYQNRHVLDKTFDLVTFDKEGCDDLAELAEQNVDFSAISVNYVKVKMPGVYNALRVVSSNLMLIGLAVIAVLLMVLVIVLNRRSLRFGVRDCAVSVAVLSVALLLATGVTYLLPLILAGKNGIGYLAALVLSEVLLSGIWISVTALGISVIALLICWIIGVIRRKKNDK